MTDDKDKYELIKMVYEKQHFFIDRHETMAGKLLTTLTILMGATTLLIINLKNIFSDSANVTVYYIYFLYLSFIIALIFSLIALFFALLAVNPLSSKAVNESDIRLLRNREKSWITSSLIYYRGLVDFFNSNKDGGILDIYSKLLNIKNLSDDLMKQIFILSLYSDYKRRVLELSFFYMKIAVFFFIFSIILVGLIFILGIESHFAS
jgi:hypothetical protein